MFMAAVAASPAWESAGREGPGHHHLPADGHVDRLAAMSPSASISMATRPRPTGPTSSNSQIRSSRSVEWDLMVCSRPTPFAPGAGFGG